MSERLSVLVVDDDRLSRVSTVRQLQAAGYRSESTESAYTALQRLQAGQWDVVLTDLRMPHMDGMEFLTKIKELYPDIDVILMTAFGTVETAVKALQAGASDYLLKPFHFEELDIRLRRWHRLRETKGELDNLRGLLDDAVEMHGLVGCSEKQKEVWAWISRFAKSDAPILITGETGTGKELVSRALHNESDRAEAPFVAIGCGTIPKDLAETEFFGHAKGAFTGAVQSRRGSFARADGGTVLLDDIDDLSLDLQVKLLRILQEGTFTPVGGERECAVDVRIVATTKIDLAAAVSEGMFRADLFYRLRGLEIRLPPLRERTEDILVISQHFLRNAATKEKRPHVPQLTPEAAEILTRYPWPGNVRELRRAVESVLVICAGDTVEPRHLPQFLTSESDPGRLFSLHLEGCDNLSYAELVRGFEHELLTWALMQSGGNQGAAAKLLGLPRTTFQSKLQSHYDS